MMTASNTWIQQRKEEEHELFKRMAKLLISLTLNNPGIGLNPYLRSQMAEQFANDLASELEKL